MSNSSQEIFKYYVSVATKLDGGNKMVKRIMVTLDDEQYEVIKKLKGFGTKDAEKIRNIVIAFLSEKSYLKSLHEG
jgi:hypothetical protein